MVGFETTWCAPADIIQGLQGVSILERVVEDAHFC